MNRVRGRNLATQYDSLPAINQSEHLYYNATSRERIGGANTDKKRAVSCLGVLTYRRFSDIIFLLFRRQYASFVSSNAAPVVAGAPTQSVVRWRSPWKHQSVRLSVTSDSSKSSTLCFKKFHPLLVCTITYFILNRF